MEDNLSIDVGIIATLMENISMRDHCDNNGIWAKSVRILRSQIFDRDLHNIGHGSNVGPLTNMYLFYINMNIAPSSTPRFYSTI